MEDLWRNCGVFVGVGVANGIGGVDLGILLGLLCFTGVRGSAKASECVSLMCRFCNCVVKLRLRFLVRIQTTGDEVGGGPDLLKLDMLCCFAGGGMLFRDGVSIAFGPRILGREGFLLLFACASCDA